MRQIELADAPAVTNDGVSEPGQPAVDEGRIGLAARVVDDLAGDEALAGRVSQIDVTDRRNAIVLLDDDPTLIYLGDEQFARRLNEYIALADRLHESVPDMEYVDLRFGRNITARGAGRGGARPVAKD